VQHKRNIEKNISFDDDVISKEKPKLRSKVFLPQWLDIEEFKLWLRQLQDNVNLFSCSICDITHVAGLSQIYRHALSKMYKKNEMKYKRANLIKKIYKLVNHFYYLKSGKNQWKYDMQL